MECANKRLWASVLVQAIKDVQGNYLRYREEAFKWLQSESMEVGSFLWVCSVLELDPLGFQFVCVDAQCSQKISCFESPSFTFQ